MKRSKSCLIGLVVVCLTMISLAGCIGVPQSEFEALQVEYEALQAEQASLVAENTSVKGHLGEVQLDLTSVQADYEALQADYEAIDEELAAIKEVYPPRDFSSLRELEDWLLANDVSDLPLSTTAEGWYSKALRVQEDALKDGYVIFVDYDYDPETDLWYIFCITIIDGDIWFWDPETDELFQEYGLGKVK